MATVLATATPARLAAAKMALSTSGTQTYGTARYTGSSLYGPAPPPSVTRTVLSPAERAGLVFDPSTLALQRQEARSPAMRRAVISMYGKAYPERPGVIMPDMPELDRMRLRSPETQRRVERLHYPERAVDFLQTLAPAGTRQDERVVGVLVGRQGLRGVLLRRDEPMPREPFLGASAARKPSGDRLLDAISAVRGGVSRGYGESKTMRLAGKAYFERGTELVRRGATPLDRAMGSLYRVRGFSQMALGKLGEVGAGSVALAAFPEQTAASLWKMFRHPVATGKELVTEVRRDPTTAIDVYFQGQLLGRAGGALYRRSPVKLRLESLKVPSGKGELMRQWTGVSAEVGQRGYPLVGFGRPRTMGGTGIFKLGTPSIRAEAVDLSQGWTVSSPGQTAIFTRALKGLTSPVEQAKFGKTLAMMRATERTPSAFTAKAFSRELGSLSPRGADVVLRFAKAEQGAAGVLYGSKAQQAQVPPELWQRYRQGRPPADIDIQLQVSAQEAAAAAARLTRELGKAGERVRISKETPTLIESRIRGEWKHAVDIHSLDQALKDLRSPAIQAGKVYGLSIEQPTIKIGGIRAMRLSEQGVRKGGSILTLREEGFQPAAHRMKDISDFFMTQEALARSKRFAWQRASGLRLLEESKKAWGFQERPGVVRMWQDFSAGKASSPSLRVMPVSHYSPRSAASRSRALRSVSRSISGSRSAAFPPSRISSMSVSRSMLRSPSPSASRSAYRSVFGSRSVSRSVRSVSRSISGSTGRSRSRSASRSRSPFTGGPPQTPSAYLFGSRAPSRRLRGGRRRLGYFERYWQIGGWKRLLGG